MNVFLKEENKKTYHLTKKNLKKHIIRLINAIITILFNFENAVLYFVFRSQLIVIDEVIRAVESNVWNILKNYFKTFLVMIKNEAQLRLIILNIHKNNDFKNSLKMFLFYKLKFLNQSSMFFSVQYRMINVIDFMISKLFYANQVTNNERTFIVDRSLSRAIINYFTKTYNVSSSVMLFQVKEEILKNSTHSLYNLISASTILNLMIKMIERNVMQSREMFIIIFYRTQFKLYKQILRNLSLMKSKLLNIQIRTMNFMQECQKSFIFLDLMICQQLNFMRIKNRVNEICFKTEHVMMIIDDID